MAKDSGTLRECLLVALPYYYLTGLVVVIGVVLGLEFFQASNHPLAKTRGLLAAFANWDGDWYEKIAADGYTYDPEQPSRVAFFPAYPLLARPLIEVFGCSPVVALLIVSQLSLVGAFAVLLAYVRLRFPEQPFELAEYTALALGLFPTTFYFRMAYTESLFLFLSLLTFYGMERKWNVVFLAALVGLATATRPVGLVLVPPLLLHIWSQASHWRWLALQSAALLPAAVWGILGYTAFLSRAFGDPLAFAKTQAHFHNRPPVPLAEKALDLLVLQPMWSLYDPGSPCYYGSRESIPPLLSLYCANPVYWLLAGTLLVTGGVTRWLNGRELWLGGLLLLVPYAARGHEMCMCSQARFAAAIFPTYLVLGNILARLPPALAALFLSLSSVLLAVYSGAFATWYVTY